MTNHTNSNEEHSKTSLFLVDSNRVKAGALNEHLATLETLRKIKISPEVEPLFSLGGR